MENEKLKLLLNKVVEFNNPKANDGKGRHFKAFLYKNRMGEYYLKVVEVLMLAENQIAGINTEIYEMQGECNHTNENGDSSLRTLHPFKNCTICGSVI